MLYGSNVFRFDDHPHNDDKHTIPGFKMSLPCCDLLTMYFFLVSIGKGNRERLQHIHLNFSDSSFIQYPEEGSDKHILTWNAGASFVGDAMDLLAASHHLQTLSVSFDRLEYLSEENERIFSDANIAIKNLFFACPKLAGRISAIRGIEQFRCPRVDQFKDKYPGLKKRFDKNIKDMKAQMEVGNP